MGKRKSGVHLEGFFIISQPEHQQARKHSEVTGRMTIIVLPKAPTVLPGLLS